MKSKKGLSFQKQPYEEKKENLEEQQIFMQLKNTDLHVTTIAFILSCNSKWYLSALIPATERAEVVFIRINSSGAKSRNRQYLDLMQQFM